uniref:Uncharacterized protein n=1 Tax=Arundo donax TaxID=35708 RepID=A0A0A9AT92_ARUDO
MSDSYTYGQLRTYKSCGTQRGRAGPGPACVF